MFRDEQDNPVLDAILAAEALVGCAITIHDRSGIFRAAGDRYLLNRTRGIHRHPCCRLIHDHRCLAECRDRIDALCGERTRPFAHTCWKGLSEIVVPVMREGTLLFIMFAGVFRAAAKKRTLPDARLKDSWQRQYAALPVMTREREQELAALFAAVGNGLVQAVEEINLPSGHDGGRKGEIRRFLHYNAHRNVGMTDLARALSLSRYRTSHLVTELFGVPFRKLLQQERLQRARTLLVSNPDRPVAAIAALVGMGDEYHFNREFKKMYGMPPGRYRKANGGGAGPDVL